MGRNDNYHHHKSSHIKHSGSKHHRQHQQHGPSNSSYHATRPEPFEGYCVPSPFHMTNFIQPPPLIQQFNPMFNPQQQQLYYNQAQQHALPIDSDISQTLLMQNSRFPPQQVCNSQWLNLNINPNMSRPIDALSGNQAISTEALNRLQLPANQITETGIIPNTPYYELPAGLMVPLIPHNQVEYKPLNPADLRLPLPKFPDENFLKSIDAYYGSDGKPRDSIGWDREFIETFIGQKQALASV